VLHRLLRRGHEVSALVRDPERAGRLTDHRGVHVTVGHLGDDQALEQVMAGADAAVHLVGIIVEIGAQTFERVHVGGTSRLVAAARAAGVRRFVQMSALGARHDEGATAYHRTKAAGEDVVRGSGLAHAILRPSLIAGEGSAPLKMMIDMVRFAPLVPVIGDGRYRMQPVWLEDVAEAFAVAVERSDIEGSFDLAGPDALTWHEMLDLVERSLGVKRTRIAVPLNLARFGALAGLALPEIAPLTPEQLQMLLEGSTTDSTALEAIFGVRPRRFADVIREMCAPFAPAGL
jgi:NADH dehydrogenase